MCRPPAHCSMRILDRSLFKKKVSLAAARVYENNQISRLRTELRKELLDLEKVSSVKPDPQDQNAVSGRKVLLLKPEIRPNQPMTWGHKLKALVDQRKVTVTPYDLFLTYDHWSYLDILKAILPADNQDELPTGFSIVGHVAHLNLRDQYLPYKEIIASVLMDKNPVIRTVINKIESVGAQNIYRTFQYELLAGDPSLNVEIRELDCTFRFDYSQVYWNSRLNTEHERLVKTFQPGEAVCDVMAGVGPFAIPAGKRRIFVWANDLNPQSYASLQDAITRNKVSRFVKPFNEDGRAFICRSVENLLKEDCVIRIEPHRRRHSGSTGRLKSNAPATSTVMTQPKTFQHFVMNLPATAITFLDAFIGLYRGKELCFAPFTDTKLPLVHVYCFSTKSDDNTAAKGTICHEISQRIGYPVTPNTPEVEIWDVRDVAPQKRMFCATFRLPPEVAFRRPSAETFDDSTAQTSA